MQYNLFVPFVNGFYYSSVGTMPHSINPRCSPCAVCLIDAFIPQRPYTGYILDIFFSDIFTARMSRSLCKSQKQRDTIRRRT